MTLYTLILFVHVAAVLILFAALTLEALSLFHLRRVQALVEVRLWLEAVPKLPVIAMGSLLIVLFSGIYLAVRISAFGAGWPEATIAALLLVAPISAMSGRRMRAIRRAADRAAATNPELRARLQDPVLQASAGIRISLVLGTVLVMGAKPGLRESAVILGACFVLGILSPLLPPHRPAVLSASRADIRD